MSTHRPRIGLIGVGRIGRLHAGNLMSLPDADLTVVADPFIDGANSVAERCGARATASPEEAIDSCELDAVVIASPTSTHADLLRRAVKAGLPVLCEKPIDLDIAKVDDLAPLVRESGVPVAVGFNRRFDRDFADARARVAAGDIGSLEQLTITSRDPEPPPVDYIRQSGGIFRDMTIHDFDLARFFAPDIIEVSATGSALFDAGAREHDDFDTAMVTMKTADGALISITNSRHSSVGYDQRLEIFGGAGMLEVGNAGTSLVSYSTNRTVKATAPYQHFFLERYAQAYADEIREFVKLVRGEPSGCSTFADGRAALILADAAQTSAETGTAVSVRLNG